MVLKVIKSMSSAIILILNPFTILGSQNQSLRNSNGTEIRGIIFAENQVNPHGDYYDYDWRGARFIWTEDLELDNTILFRYRVNKRK